MLHNIELHKGLQIFQALLLMT